MEVWDYRDVNMVGMVWVIVPIYPTHWINIRLVSILMSMQVSVMWVPAYFFNIHGYYDTYICLLDIKNTRTRYS